MITYIKINGFKSFHNFEMEFTPFTVIAGVNASGKSNLFDALTLLSRLAEVDNLKKAFKEQRGEFIELFTQYSENNYADLMEFEVEMLVNKKIKDAWGGEEDLTSTRLRYALTIKRYTNNSDIEDLAVVSEALTYIKRSSDKWISILPSESVEEWRPKGGTRTTPYMTTEVEDNINTVTVSQDGTKGNKRRFPLKNSTRTVLSSFDTIEFPHVLAAKEEMKSWKFLQLNPEDLRQPTNKSTGEDVITSSGKNLAAALYRIKQEDNYNLTEISRKLNKFLPDFTNVDVFDDRENKQFLIKLKDKDKKEYTSRVLSEGTLRMLALSILEFDTKHTGLLCFEEPENGVHPFRIKSIIELLKDLSTDFINIEMPIRQIIVNTHSPVFVHNIYNWKSDQNVSLWYAEMRNRITDIKDKRFKINTTVILPVRKHEEKQLKLSLIEYSEQDIKMTVSRVKEYLENTTNIS